MLPAVEPAYAFARTVLYPPLRSGLRWVIEGAQRIPPYGPVLLASNHVSYLDPLALAFLADRRHRRVRFLAKAELFERSSIGWLLRGTRQIPVLRDSPTAAGSLQAAVDSLEGGECVVVFPEGTISMDLEPMVGKTGTARLAQLTGVPVLPVGLWGAHRILFKGRKPHWRWGIGQSAVVGAPVRVRADDDIHEATDRIMSAVCDAVSRAREIYPQRPTRGDEWWYRPPTSATLRSCRGLTAGEAS